MTIVAMTSEGNINVYGARVHNLKNIDVSLPRHSLTVITGLSGSGKSSLAFDTIYAEGQRRYIETFSSYARSYIGAPERPDVDKITGLSPVISIEQKTTNKNPRSTVGTTTEVYDFLRVLFARAGTAYSYVTGQKMVHYTEEQITNLILKEYDGCRIYLLAPVVRNRKGHYKELFESIRRRGWLNVRIDGEVKEIIPGLKLDRYKNHSIEIVVDKLEVRRDDEKRLADSIRTGMRQGKGEIVIMDITTGNAKHFSKHLVCPDTGISYHEPAPHNFSFNSPQGACPLCKGLGTIAQIDIDKVIPNRLRSIYEGAILPLGKYKDNIIFRQIEALLAKYGVNLKTPVNSLTQEAIDEIIYGSIERIPPLFLPYGGIVGYIRSAQENEESTTEKKWAEQFSKNIVCPDCHGQRLNKEALHFRIADKNIAQLAGMDIEELYEWVRHIDDVLKSGKQSSPFTEVQRKVIPEIFKEILPRLRILLDLGLGYISLNRPSYSLSGGENQRIRLAAQIGSQLVNVLYILDEPSIGLHQRDNHKLISALKHLRDVGNTVIVVEHDEEMMRAADYIIDMGPRAGRLGGEVVFQGTPDSMLHRDTLTARYLNHTQRIEVPTRRKGNGAQLTLHGASGNNLKHIDVMFPLGLFICVTGVSGSGKSTLINDTLQPILSQRLYRSLRAPLPYDSAEGLNNIDKVVAVDQSPIGRIPRSNPATYTGVFTDIRTLFAAIPEAQIRGYKPGRFSFNVKGGRCENCGGNGYLRMEMNFLPDVFVPCPVCRGKRYNRETLEVKFKGKSIADVLNMTVNQAVEFFHNQPSILSKITTLQSVGLGYIKLGQPSTTLSGGENQRIKLSAELSKRDTGRTLYILDEPTTGLHFEDIRVLLTVLNQLTDKGNTVIVIEHNLDVIKSADYIIDMGPEGGRLGGNIVFAGTPEQIARCGKGFTAQYLKQVLDHN